MSWSWTKFVPVTMTAINLTCLSFALLSTSLQQNKVQDNYLLILILLGLYKCDDKIVSVEPMTISPDVQGIPSHGSATMTAGDLKGGTSLMSPHVTLCYESGTVSTLKMGLIGCP